MENWEHTLLVEYLESAIDAQLKIICTKIHDWTFSPEWVVKNRIEQFLASELCSKLFDNYMLVLKNNRKYGYEKK